jgi:hypothetical protein
MDSTSGSWQLRKAVSYVMSTWTGQSGKDGQYITVRWDSGDKREGWPKHDRKDWTTGTGQQGWGNCGRKGMENSQYM